MRYVRHLRQLSVQDVSLAGGKGANLGALTQAGFPVPPGFVLMVDAYRAFVQANDLQEAIASALGEIDPDHVAALERAAAAVAGRFAAGRVPADVAAELGQACAALGDVPLAARSSATAEDLPEASFAGQHETFLGVVGQGALLEAVKGCWASLWTARAIAYRARRGISPGAMAMAVVVQQMVRAEVAGVLFTANPATGDPDEMIVNAAPGLGEAVVSGQVTPAEIAINRSTWKVQRRSGAARHLLTPAQAVELGRVGERIEAYYGRPQDIEWAWAGGQFHILQARPITTPIRPRLSWEPPVRGVRTMRGGVTELLPDPVSVLFETLGLPAFERAIKEYQQGAGMGPAMQDWGFVTINGYVYAWVRVSARMLLEVLRALPRLLGRAAQAPMAPEDGGLEQRAPEDGGLEQRAPEDGGLEQRAPEDGGLEQRAHEDGGLEQRAPEDGGLEQRAPEAWGETLQAYRRQVAALQGQPAGLAAQALLERMEALALACGRYWAVFAAIVPYLDRAEGRFTSLYRRLRRRDDPGPVALLRGLENRPLEAERALYRAGEGDLDAYVAEYGHAVYNLDFAVPLAGEERAALEAMRRASASLWREGAPSPDERHRRLAEEQEEAAERIRKRLAAPLLLPGCLRRLFDRALVAAQQAARVREDALFDLGLAWVPLRQYALALGRRLVEAGALAQPGHVFWLRRDELAALAESLDRQAEQETRFLAENGFLEEPISSLAGQAEARQREREAVRGVRVPFTVPERKVRGLASLFVPTAEARRQLEGDVLTGTGTSPGQVTGVARVVRGPQEFGRLGRGEILVAHATTPAWTPLFALAGGLVADLGGALSHGSVIAREYGIPAVMGTGNGTERVQDGQVVIVDGTAGKVYLKT